MSDTNIIVTGSVGNVHVTSVDDAIAHTNTALISEKIIFTCFENMRALVQSPNEIRIYSGYGMMRGRIFKVEKNTYDTVAIPSIQNAGSKRADLIVARYTIDNVTGFENINLISLQGAEGSSYVDPTYSEGDINAGASVDDFPLYRVKINGYVVEGIEQLFTLYPEGGLLGVLIRKLDTELITNLASENSGNLDDCLDESSLDIGVKNILPISHGGTNAKSATGAAKNIVIDALTADNGTMTDMTEFITSESSASFGTVLKKRNVLNIWNTILTKVKAFLGMGSGDILPVNHGGTGKSTLTNGYVLVGNGTSAVSGMAIATDLTNPSNNKLITQKGVSDAMSNAGYGDMLKSTYDPNDDGKIDFAQTSGILPVNRGGTGTTDGTLNGVKLGKSGSTYGYYDSNNTFKSFRQPTGNATAGDVLSGKTFANSSSDSVTGTLSFSGNAETSHVLSGKTFYKNSTSKLTGTMGNYADGNRRTVTPSGGTGNEVLTFTAGYHNSVTVNRTAPYNAGVTAAQSNTISLTTMLMDYANGKSSTSEMYISAKNIKSIQYTDFWCSTTPSDASVYVEFYQANGTTLISSVECTTSGQNISIPSGAVYAMFKVYVQLSTNQTFQYRARWNVTWQMKILR